MRLAFAIVLLTAFGCGAQEADPDPSPGFDLTKVSPGPGLEYAVQGAADDLREHLGVDSQLDADGIAVDIGDTLDGSCAFTDIEYHTSSMELMWVYTVVQVPPPAKCPRDIRVTVEHEMIHILRAQLTANGEEVDGPSHSTEGLFQAHIGVEGDVIEDTTAAMACDSGFCTLISLDN